MGAGPQQPVGSKAQAFCQQQQATGWAEARSPQQAKLPILPLYAQGWCGVPSLLSVPCTPLVFTSQTFLPQKYNADYDLSARQGADTLAFMSLLEEKLLPVLVSTSGPSMNSLPLRKAADTHIRETGDLEFHPQ